MDAQVAPFAHRIGIAALERLVAEAIARFMPDQAAEDAAQAAEGGTSPSSTSRSPSTAPARSAASSTSPTPWTSTPPLAQGAEALRALGSTESLDVRRSIAAGQLARNQLALDLTDTDEPAEPRAEKRAPSRGRWCCTCTSPTPRSPAPATVWSWRGWRTSARWSPPTRSSTWCANPDAQVIVKPVIDLNEHIHVEGYEVPARLREQTILRDHTCVFPWCTRSARKADADHVIPYAEGGTTSSDNIAPLCRRHHRLKTHSDVGLHDARTRVLPVVEPARLPVPARPPRHPRRQSLTGDRADPTGE